MGRITKDRLQEYLQVCITVKEVLELFGYGRGHQNYNTYHRAIIKFGLEQEHKEMLLRQKEFIIPANKISNEEFFVSGGRFKGTRVRERVLQDDLIPYVCSKCGQPPIWMESPLILHLDHINGLNTDNRLENLRFLCGHCHSQTETYGAKNRPELGKITKEDLVRCPRKVKQPPIDKLVNYCQDCQISIKLDSLRCVKCSPISKRKFKVTKEELEKLIEEMPMTKIGEMFGVSDNAVKKRAKKLGIELKSMRGYWTKRYFGKLEEQDNMPL